MHPKKSVYPPEKPAQPASVPLGAPPPAVQNNHTVRQLLPSLLTTLLFASFALILYSEVFAFGSFGPEFASFYRLNADLSLGQLAHKYIELGGTWYRPTAFYTVYWVAAKFLGWHTILGWKLVAFLTLLASCYALYALTLLLFPKCRLGAIIACIYFVSHPGMYAPLFEISAFDFPHIFLTIICVIFYVSAYHASSRKARIFGLLGLCSFVLALTSKEVTIVVPVYLTCVAVIFSLDKPPEATWRSHLRKPALSLLPYFAILALFVSLHVARMPVGTANGAYRTKANVSMIFENIKKYPMWAVRVFENTGDTLYQANEHATLTNDLFAVILFILALAQWTTDIRDAPRLQAASLMLLWVAVFLTVPIYAGGYLWHSNLALCGYAVLLGIGLARLAERLTILIARRLYVIGLLVAFMGFGMIDVGETLHAGVHATAFRINTTGVLTSPPVPASALGPNPLIYVEDRLQLGEWNYGAGHLFALAYLNPRLDELVVPKMEQVPGNLCVRWLSRPRAYFFKYDDQFVWHDSTSEFRNHALNQVTAYTNQLFSEGRGKEVAALILPFLPKLTSNGIARYHYALSLQMQGRWEAALREYAEPLRLMPTFFFGFYNRGHLYAELGRRREACDDFSHAKSIDPTYPQITSLAEKWCH